MNLLVHDFVCLVLPSKTTRKCLVWSCFAQSESYGILRASFGLDFKFHAMFSCIAP